jgi:hypothetical protein
MRSTTLALTIYPLRSLWVLKDDRLGEIAKFTTKAAAVKAADILMNDSSEASEQGGDNKLDHCEDRSSVTSRGIH